MVSQVATSVQVGTCASCGRPLDDVQMPLVWHEKPVCPACHSKLRAQEPASALCPVPGETPRHGRAHRKRSRKKWLRVACHVGQAIGILMILAAIVQGTIDMLQADPDLPAVRVLLLAIGLPGLACWLVFFAIEKRYG